MELLLHRTEMLFLEYRLRGFGRLRRVEADFSWFFILSAVSELSLVLVLGSITRLDTSLGTMTFIFGDGTAKVDGFEWECIVALYLLLC